VYHLINSPAMNQNARQNAITYKKFLQTSTIYHSKIRSTQKDSTNRNVNRLTDQTTSINLAQLQHEKLVKPQFRSGPRRVVQGQKWCDFPSHNTKVQSNPWTLASPTLYHFLAQLSQLLELLPVPKQRPGNVTNVLATAKLRKQGHTLNLTHCHFLGDCEPLIC